MHSPDLPSSSSCSIDTTTCPGLSFAVLAHGDEGEIDSSPERAGRWLIKNKRACLDMLSNTQASHVRAVLPLSVSLLLLFPKSDSDTLHIQLTSKLPRLRRNSRKEILFQSVTAPSRCLALTAVPISNEAPQRRSSACAMNDMLAATAQRLRCFSCTLFL